MAYEDSAGLGVGKVYGAKALGGIDGDVYTSGMKGTKVFQLTAETIDDVYDTIINSDYLVTGLVLNVKEAFAASSTADLSIDGGAGLTTDLNLVTLGVSSPALTGLANTSGSGPVEVVLTPNANALASATGDAELIVQYDIAG